MFRLCLLFLFFSLPTLDSLGDEYCAAVLSEESQSEIAFGVAISLASELMSLEETKDSLKALVLNLTEEFPKPNRRKDIKNLNDDEKKTIHLHAELDSMKGYLAKNDWNEAKKSAAVALNLYRIDPGHISKTAQRLLELINLIDRARSLDEGATLLDFERKGKVWGVSSQKNPKVNEILTKVMESPDEYNPDVLERGAVSSSEESAVASASSSEASGSETPLTSAAALKGYHVTVCYDDTARMGQKCSDPSFVRAIEGALLVKGVDVFGEHVALVLGTPAGGSAGSGHISIMKLVGIGNPQNTLFKEAILKKLREIFSKLSIVFVAPDKCSCRGGGVRKCEVRSLRAPESQVRRGPLSSPPPPRKKSRKNDDSDDDSISLRGRGLILPESVFVRQPYLDEKG